MARDGSLWIGTNGGGVSRMKDGKFTNFSMRHGLTHDVVWAVYEDREGVIWIGTRSGALPISEMGGLSRSRPSTAWTVCP